MDRLAGFLKKPEGRRHLLVEVTESFHIFRHKLKNHGAIEEAKYYVCLQNSILECYLSAGSSINPDVVFLSDFAPSVGEKFTRIVHIFYAHDRVGGGPEGCPAIKNILARVGNSVTFRKFQLSISYLRKQFTKTCSYR